MNDDVASDTKMELMRQCILQSEQTTKDSMQIVSLFRRILERPQQNADLAMLCAQYMITKNMKKESVPVLEQVLSLDPENKPARLQLLSYAIQDNELDEVVRIAKSALEYHPEALEFYYYLGVAYYQKEELDEALDVFTRGVKQVNEKSDKGVVSDFYAILGDIYHQKGRAAEAYAAYDSSLVYNPDNIGTLNNYAYYLSIEKKNLDKAEEMSYRTVKAEPDNDTYLDTYAWILSRKVVTPKHVSTSSRLCAMEERRAGSSWSIVVIFIICWVKKIKLWNTGKRQMPWRRWKKGKLHLPSRKSNA